MRKITDPEYVIQDSDYSWSKKWWGREGGLLLKRGGKQTKIALLIKKDGWLPRLLDKVSL